MKYLAEYHDPEVARALIARIRARATRRWVLMEVCGGQTHTIVRQGIDELLIDLVAVRSNFFHDRSPGGVCDEGLARIAAP